MYKRTLMFIIILMISATVFISCSDDDGGGTTPEPDPEINLIFPNGGDNLVMGVPYVITWENYTDTLNIEFYKGADSNAVKIFEFTDVASNGEFQFTVPIDLNIGNDYKVKIVSVIDSSISDESDDFFSISNINLLFPNGGESLVIGDSYVITWENYTDTLNIEFYKGADSNAVKVFEFTDVVSNGEFQFIVPTDLNIGDDYKVKIVSVIDSSISDESNDYFSISNIVTGKWNVQGIWSKWDGIWEFFNDGTWTNSLGSSGTWNLVGNDISWEYPSGTFYTGVVEDDTMSGIMDGGSGLVGTWDAQRIID